MKFSEQRRSLLSSNARIQVPWVKVTIGYFTFGCYTNIGKAMLTGSPDNGAGGWNLNYRVQYPEFVKSLEVTKINGQVNQYTLTILYPITQQDDPNFFEKVFSSVSKSRKIVFTYGDCSQPSYIYKEEEAIITKVGSSFNLQSSAIQYTVYAVSGAQLRTLGCATFPARIAKPSDVIKEMFKNPAYGLQDSFTGMRADMLDRLIDGSDKEVQLDLKINTSVMEYLTYLVSCMQSSGDTQGNRSSDIYILNLRDDTIYDRLYDDYVDETETSGPYFTVTKVSDLIEHSDAYEIDIGFNNSTVINRFSIDHNENYSIYYDYQTGLARDDYVRRIGDDGKIHEIFSPNVTSKNRTCSTRPDDISWWTKITKYPINATINIQGLLRPAHLMTYLRLNILFYGERHIGSGLYIVTSQKDLIDENGYKTTLNMVKINGD